MASLVRPEYGPSLPELTGARWPRVRLALVIAGVLIALFVAYRLLIAPGLGQTAVVVRTPVAFNLVHDSGLEKVAPRPPEVLRLQSPPGSGVQQRLTVTPWTLPPYTGTDPGGVLPAYAGEVAAGLARELPGYTTRSEGRARVNTTPGYVVAYQFTRGGEVWYGRRYLMYPDVPSPRQGAIVDLQARRTTAVSNPDAVGRSGPVKLPLRSFRFGTERP